VNPAFYNHINLIGNTQGASPSPPVRKSSPPDKEDDFSLIFDRMANEIAERGLIPVQFSNFSPADIRPQDFKARKRIGTFNTDNGDSFERNRNRSHNRNNDVYSSAFKSTLLVIDTDKTLEGYGRDGTSQVIDHYDYTVLDKEETLT
jgi:hypothetical protein